MALRVLPEGLSTATAAIETSTARLVAASAGPPPPLTVVVVATAVDPMSLQSAAGFSIHGGQHAAAQRPEELGRPGIGVAESGASYAAGDAAAASSYLPAGL